MGMFLGGVLGVLSAIAGFIMLLVAVVMVAVHPWQLVWVAPAALALLWLARRALRPRNDRPVDGARIAAMLYPDGYEAPRQHHLVEPMTMGGHIRHTHHGRVDGEWR